MIALLMSKAGIALIITAGVVAVACLCCGGLIALAMLDPGTAP